MQEPVQTDATFPERVYKLAREYQVGVPVKAYRLAMRWWFIGLSSAVLLFTIFLAMDIHQYIRDKAEAQQSAQFFASCQTCRQADKDFDRQASASFLSNDGDQILNDAEALVSGLIVIAFLLYFRRRFLLYKCSEGLLFAFTKKGTLALHWAEIVYVYWKGDRIRALHEADAKRELDLTLFLDNHEISEYVESEVTPRLLAQALEQYKQTGSIQFGYLSIQREGLVMNNPSVTWANGERVVSWQDLEDIRFVDGMLSLKLQGEWRGWASSLRRQKRLASALPNPTVYVALAKYVLENARIEEKRIGE